MMSTSTIMLIDEIMNYMYSRDWMSMCCKKNWVFCSGFTGYDVSCSLALFLWHWSRIQWYLSTSRSSNSLPAQKSWSTMNLSLPLPLSSLFIWESLDVTFLSSGNDDFPIIITFCVFGGSFCKLQSHLCQCPSSFWHWIAWWHLFVILYFLIVGLRSQSTQPLLYVVAPDH